MSFNLLTNDLFQLPMFAVLGWLSKDCLCFFNHLLVATELFVVFKSDDFDENNFLMLVFIQHVSACALFSISADCGY